jgi:hypothetical protein
VTEYTLIIVGFELSCLAILACLISAIMGWHPIRRSVRIRRAVRIALELSALTVLSVLPKPVVRRHRLVTS